MLVPLSFSSSFHFHPKQLHTSSSSALKREAAYNALIASRSTTTAAAEVVGGGRWLKEEELNRSDEKREKLPVTQFPIKISKEQHGVNMSDGTVK